MDNTSDSSFFTLETPNEYVTFNNSILTVFNGSEQLFEFDNIVSLLVESLFSIRKYFKIAPGEFIGFGNDNSLK